MPHKNNTGTVMMIDPRSSILGQQLAEEGGQLERQIRHLDEYLESVLGVLYERSRDYSIEVLEVSDRGDGCAVAWRPSPLSLNFALDLQDECDQLADRFLRDWKLGEGDLLEQQFYWATGIGVATDELRPVRSDERVDAGEGVAKHAHAPSSVGRLSNKNDWLLRKGFSRKVTGEAFNTAKRIEAKAKPRKACLSPLLDERTYHDSKESATDMKVFPVGHFVIDKKLPLETPVLNIFPGQSSNHERLFSVVRRGSVLEGAAELFERVMTQVFHHQRRVAMDSIVQLREYLDQHRAEILREHGRAALWRWSHAVHHYSFLTDGGR